MEVAVNIVVAVVVQGVAVAGYKERGAAVQGVAVAGYKERGAAVQGVAAVAVQEVGAEAMKELRQWR
ncbi:hypothetical protein F2Q70_00044504 [Brassica cretica]|uniref:Uncharacterized protein n=1 Tax=Brassica cretica TaxID=69181 RepID=A0A8S9KGK6_BRACR|nr:hypothetical protein F2Q70_00044504 [Brassica cretica]